MEETIEVFRIKEWSIQKKNNMIYLCNDTIDEPIETKPMCMLWFKVFKEHIYDELNKKKIVL